MWNIHSVIIKTVICPVLMLNTIISFAYSSSIHSRDLYNAKCTDPETNRELYIGEFFTRPGQCIRVQCLGTLELWEDRCQIPQLKGDCIQLPAANEFLDYPRCCSNYECKSTKSDDKSTTDEIRLYDHYGRLLREHITQRVKVLLMSHVAAKAGNTSGSKIISATDTDSENL